jgi:hypothetical protein
VKVVAPTQQLAEAAEVLADVREDVVVVRAAALEVALAEVDSVLLTPTRDVDVVVPTERAADVVARLEAADLQRSQLGHERNFTWVRGDLKVRLGRRQAARRRGRSDHCRRSSNGAASRRGVSAGSRGGRQTSREPGPEAAARITVTQCSVKKRSPSVALQSPANQQDFQLVRRPSNMRLNAIR